MDHDRLFKQLLQTYFVEFLELFCADLLAHIEPGSIEFLDKEIFTDLAGGDRHEVDLLVKCRFRGEWVCFLIHVEVQASPQADFAARMFWYFARLTESHKLPVYPIALFTFDTPQRPEADTFEVAFPGRPVLSFRYHAIQLNQLNWRDFVRRPNPVAAALMTKMKIATEDRPRVKLECLRLMVTLKLDRAKQALIREFMDSYLRLSAAEMGVYNRELKSIDPPEREAVMEVINEWEALGEARGIALGEARGIAMGEARGKADLVLGLLRQRFGAVPDELRQHVTSLSSSKLQEFGEAVLGFSSAADAKAWIAVHG
ncbi:DUF4351 domain-containing protein [Humisphaera borealis]|uniref:DUF4351 domain-containing protein n=1 Tax=Humisphaera borealis TaxID=2807512 RepID=A0A7M2WPG1_9BACT|nr:DUF4351 domain-containing protein [Humisphaera borealis]QOV87358.1 DUF4351 domain-containing protein [Humisphaera borealis]